MTAPRCGLPVRRKEQGGIPVLEDPVCGRPEGHNGRCRSEAAVTRKYQADVIRLAAAVQLCACGCGETALWGHRYRRGHNPRGAGGAWRQAA